MVHLGKEDLAAIAAERAATSAADGDDELLDACMRGTYAWVLLHQGRWTKQSAWPPIRPSRSSRCSPHQPITRRLGSLLMTALAPAAAAGRDVSGYLTLASSGAERIGGPVKIFNTTFAPASVATQAVHAYAVLRDPAKALQAARKVDVGELPGTIARGRHLLDVAQAQVDARHSQAATATLARARTMAPVWFRHQGIARSLVAELCEQQRRLTPQLRETRHVRRPGLVRPVPPARKLTAPQVHPVPGPSPYTGCELPVITSQTHMRSGRPKHGRTNDDRTRRRLQRHAGQPRNHPR